MSAPLWPFPGQEAAEAFGPCQPLPLARFAAGDSVATRWGRGTVIAVQECAWNAYRAYGVRHTWSSAPEGFGHFFDEDELELAASLECPEEETDEVPPPVRAAPQLDLFA